MAVSGSPVRAEPRYGSSPYIRLQLVLVLFHSDGIGTPQPVLPTGTSRADRHCVSAAASRVSACASVCASAKSAFGGCTAGAAPPGAAEPSWGELFPLAATAATAMGLTRIATTATVLRGVSLTSERFRSDGMRTAMVLSCAVDPGAAGNACTDDGPTPPSPSTRAQWQEAHERSLRVRLSAEGENLALELT